MSNHEDDTCPHLVRANLLESENARLRSFCTRTIIPNIDLERENARLKAEVERLTKAIDLTIIDLDERHERQDLRAWEFAELLRKAKGVQS
jgi:hypothetical protein